MKFNVSHKSYKNACLNAYVVNMSNPTIFWNAIDGFYVGSGLIQNDDLNLGLCYYGLNSGGKRSHTGSKSEYAPIGRGIRSGIRSGFTRPEDLKNCIQNETQNAYEQDLI